MDILIITSFAVLSWLCFIILALLSPFLAAEPSWKLWVWPQKTSDLTQKLWVWPKKPQLWPKTPQIWPKPLGELHQIRSLRVPVWSGGRGTAWKWQIRWNYTILIFFSPTEGMSCWLGTCLKCREMGERKKKRFFSKFSGAGGDISKGP